MCRQIRFFLLINLLFQFSGPGYASAEAGDLPVVLNPAVEAHIAYFTSGGKAGLQTWFNNSAAYLPVMKEIFRNENLPEELAYVAMVESGLDPRAVSHANAAGFWQLMPDTARQYRLRGDSWVDERRDLVKSTRAAARHLSFLRARLGSWAMVLAAYNAGLTTMRAAIRETRSEYFWDLRESGVLPRETSQFVPRIMAVVLIARDPAAFGFRVPPPKPVLFDMLFVPAATDLGTLAQAIGTTYSAISSLNPEMNGPSTPPQESWYLKIPKGTRKAYAGASRIPFAAACGDRGNLFCMNPNIPVAQWFTNPSMYYGKISIKMIAHTPAIMGLNNRRKTSVPRFSHLRQPKAGGYGS